MKQVVECAKITVQIPKEKFHLAVNALKELGVLHYYTQSSRSVALKEREAFLFWSAKIELFENNAELIKFFIPKEYQKPMIMELANRLSLHINGNGSVYGESVEAIYDDRVDIINTKSIKLSENIKCTAMMADSLWAISCILQRGEADHVVKAALDLGVGIPSVTFGIGTGFRDKLGLLRVVVPAEKEVINLVVHKSNVAEVMDTLINAGELEMPGKGFIYNYPLGPGVINSKMFYGKQRHLATMEQIISAMDTVKGSVTWRIRESSAQIKEHKMLKDLCGMNMYCNDGRASDLIDAAMEAGSSGTTVGLGKLRCEENSDVLIAPSQEISTMIVGFDKIEEIVEAVEKAGLFEEFGMIELKSVEEACTYLG